MASKVSQKKVLAEINRWIDWLGLTNWQVEVEFSESAPKTKKERTMAQISCAAVDEGYRSAKMKIYLPNYSIKSDRDRSLTLIHELLHMRFAHLDATMTEYIGVDTVVAKAFDAEIETLCDKMAIREYNLFRRRRTPLTNASK